MGLLSLLEVSSTPLVMLLLVGLLGAFMATDYLKLLPTGPRKSLNRIVFMVFTPSLVFSSLAKTVNFQDLISWWFMPINIGFTFLVGGALGWLAVKLLRPQPHLQYLIIAMCASGSLGNIPLILIPALCEEKGNPFGDKTTCQRIGVSYVSFSMAFGNLYVWTYAYHLIRCAGVTYKAMLPENDTSKTYRTIETPLLLNGDDVHPSKKIMKCIAATWSKMFDIFYRIMAELKSPPIIAAIAGLVFGTISWLHHLIIGDTAPLRAIDEAIALLGNGTMPCIILILGANLKQGLSKVGLNSRMVIAVISVRYIILPTIGIGVVKAASHLGFLPSDPLFHFILMLQFALPPAMNIGTMTQLFDVAQEECSILYLWTYVVAAIALTGWTTVFMWILS